MARTNIYRYFCPIARSLELVGEKWTLPIVLSLLLEGPLRFNDLQRELASITPKSLTSRLRDLEAVGLLERERAATGEVRYGLTPAGRDLGPVLTALNRWSIEHEVRPPDPDEALKSDPVARSIWSYFIALRVKLDGPRTWHLHVGRDEVVTLAYDSRRWSHIDGPAGEPTLTIRASVSDWAAFLATGPADRAAAATALEFSGDAAERREFLGFFGLPDTGPGLTAPSPSLTVGG